MGRPPQFGRDEILDAAAALLSGAGPSGVTIQALAKRSGAPTGSIYHRFASLERLLAEVWLRTVARFQDGFQRALEADGDCIEAAVEAALYTPRWSRTHFGDARILLLHRREDLARRWPSELGPALAALHAQGAEAMRAFARRHFGRATRKALTTATFALVDVPYAAVRRHLVAGRTPPKTVDALVETACRALLG